MIDVVAAVINRGAEYLIARRPHAKQHGGLWEFPGGKVGPGESFEQALQRELFEELGLTLVTVGETLQSLLDDQHIIHFLAVTTKEEPECREHLELRWCSAMCLAELKLCPTDARFAALL